MGREFDIIYTFRTNKHLSEFKKLDSELFVFGNLKNDLEKFKELVRIKKPRYIVGLAEVRGQTVIESVAVNRFGLKKKINISGQESYKLTIPDNNIFEISNKPTTTFCNWTMYKIREIIDSTDIKHVFLHFNSRDLLKVINFLEKYDSRNRSNFT